MTDNLNALETSMDTSTFDDHEMLALPAASDRSASALRCLMRDWERYGVVEEEDSETELMVLLDGMVSVSDPATSDA